MRSNLLARPVPSVQRPRRRGGTERWRWRLVRELLRGSAAFVLLLFPTMLLAVDHHGAERIPTHEHVVALGELTPAHVHPFERVHGHEHAEASAGGDVVVRGPGVGGALSTPVPAPLQSALLMLTAAPAVPWLLALAAPARGARSPSSGHRPHERLEAPPTHPPR